MGISNVQSVITQYKILGARTAAQNNYGVARSANAVALANEKMGASALVASRKMGFMANQMRFTGRRMLFYGTLVFAALGAAALKMGFSYQNAVQTTRVALGPLFKDQSKLEEQIRRLYKIAVFSPFLFKDTVAGFRLLYQSFQPLGISAGKTVQTIQALIDYLSITGKTTPAALDKASRALVHMSYQGRLTGIVVRQLSSYFPISDVLRKELGVTADQMKNIANLNIAPGTVLDALLHYRQTHPAILDAAKRISQGTLPGLIAQFKDILSQVMGGTTAGAFSFLERALKRVNNAMAPLMDQKKPPKLVNVIEAIDKALSPKTHIIINVFTMIASALNIVTKAIGLLVIGIQQFLDKSGLDTLANKFDSSRIAAKLLGWWIGFLGTVAVLYATKVVIAAIATDFWALSVWGLRTVFRAATIALAIFEFAIAVFSNPVRTAQIAVSLLITAFTALRNILWGATFAATGLDIALGPVVLVTTLILLIVVLTVLYFKWKRFHDLVNKTIKWLYDHPWAAFLIPGVNIFASLIVAARLLENIYNWGKRIRNLFKNVFTFKIHVKIDKGGIFGLLKKAAQVTMQVADPLGVQRVALRGVTGNRTNFLGRSPLTGLQEGGTVTRSGMAMVGEGGPEIVALPASAQVIPLDRAGRNMSGWPEFPRELNLKTVLRVDGKDIAQVVAQHRLDRQARR